MKHVKLFEDYYSAVKKSFTVLGIYDHDDYESFRLDNSKLCSDNRYKYLFDLSKNDFLIKEAWKNFVKKDHLFIILRDEINGEIFGVVAYVSNRDFVITPRAFRKSSYDILSRGYTEQITYSILGPSPLEGKILNSFYSKIDPSLSDDQIERIADKIISKNDLNLISAIQKSAPRIWGKIQARMGGDKADTAADLGNLGF